MIQASGTARETGSPSLRGLDKQGRKCFWVVRKEGNTSQACHCQVHSLFPHSTGALGCYSLMHRQWVGLRSPCVRVSKERQSATGGHCSSVPRAWKITFNSFFFFLFTRILITSDYDSKARDSFYYDVLFKRVEKLHTKT